MMFYQVIGTFTGQEFLYFTDPANETMQILLAHFVALHVIVDPVIDREEFRSKNSWGVQKFRKWFGGLRTAIRPSKQVYLAWPVEVINTDATCLRTEC